MQGVRWGFMSLGTSWGVSSAVLLLWPWDLLSRLRHLGSVPWAGLVASCLHKLRSLNSVPGPGPGAGCFWDQGLRPPAMAGTNVWRLSMDTTTGEGWEVGFSRLPLGLPSFGQT